MEIWKPVPSLQGYYEASNLGRVRSVTRELPWKSKTGTSFTRVRKGRILKASKCRYMQLHLSVDNKKFSAYAHRLVAEAFVPNPDNKREVDHINGDRYDNRPENLRWVTPSENMTAAYDNNQQHHGAKNHYAKLTEEQVFEILELRQTTDLSYEKIGEMYGVSSGAIALIVKGERWKRVTNL